MINLEDGSQRVHVKGGSEVIVDFCRYIIDTFGKEIELENATKERINEVINTMASKSLRTIALAYRHLEKDENPYEKDHEGWPKVEQGEMTLIGIFGIMDPLRSEVVGAIRTCRQAGVTVKMVTGDNV